MTLQEIEEEYRQNGRISGQAIVSLRRQLRAAGDPYRAISVAGDCGAFPLSADIAVYLKHTDPMVRWNAASVLFNRFRIVALAAYCLEMAETEVDEVARGAAITGVGELLPLVDEPALRLRMATSLLRIFEQSTELTEMRGAAYEGIEAAMGIPPTRRVPASRLIDLERDVDRQLVAAYRQQFVGTS